MRHIIFGESHGPAIGVVLEGLPSGVALDMDVIASELARRAENSRWLPKLTKARRTSGWKTTTRIAPLKRAKLRINSMWSR